VVTVTLPDWAKQARWFERKLRFALFVFVFVFVLFLFGLFVPAARFAGPVALFENKRVVVARFALFCFVRATLWHKARKMHGAYQHGLGSNELFNEPSRIREAWHSLLH
jgi:hypothetical protein